MLKKEHKRKKEKDEKNKAKKTREKMQDDGKSKIRGKEVKKKIFFKGNAKD